MYNSGLSACAPCIYPEIHPSLMDDGPRIAKLRKNAINIVCPDTLVPITFESLDTSASNSTFNLPLTRKRRSNAIEIVSPDTVKSVDTNDIYPSGLNIPFKLPLIRKRRNKPTNTLVPIAVESVDTNNVSPPSSSEPNSTVDLPLAPKRRSKAIEIVNPDTLLPITIESVDTNNISPPSSSAVIVPRRRRIVSPDNNTLELQLAEQLSKYIMNPSCLMQYGFPVVCDDGLVEINKPSFSHNDHSWCGSATEQETNSNGNRSSTEKECHRCKRAFHVTEDGHYLITERCTYHWGKLVRRQTANFNYRTSYTCCQGATDSIGCSQHTHHVWSGTVQGFNGPYMDFVNTIETPNKIPGRFDKIFALDCEMSYTGRGLELTNITVIGYNGVVVYDHFVRPEADIIDYNTRFSGVTEQDLNGHSQTEVKTLSQVQDDLMEIFDTNTIIIGHGLENDFRVLRIVHEAVIDTSIVFPHNSGFPYKLSLKSLAKIVLNRDIQMGYNGHCSYEDARTCLDLMVEKVRADGKLRERLVKF